MTRINLTNMNLYGEVSGRTFDTAEKTMRGSIFTAKEMTSAASVGGRTNETDSNSATAAVNSAKLSSSDKVAGTFSNIDNVTYSFRVNNSVKEINLPNGTKVLGYRFTKFDNCQPEWIELQKYMAQAANEMGLTLVYGDVNRTVSQSDAGRKNKGDVVAKGGESPHNYGVAADIVLFQNGKTINKKSAIQRQFAQRVKELSNNKIEWGGDWNKDNEEHHFNIRNWEQNYKKPCYLIK